MRHARGYVARRPLHALLRPRHVLGAEPLVAYQDGDHPAEPADHARRCPRLCCPAGRPPYGRWSTPAKGNGTLGTPRGGHCLPEAPDGRVFTTYWWSDYLIYENIPVFVDGRTDVYFGTGILETYVNVSEVSIDPDPVFRHWDVRWVMWNKDTTLAMYLSHDPAWKTVYRSGDAVVFEHVGSWGLGRSQSGAGWGIADRECKPVHGRQMAWSEC